MEDRHRFSLQHRAEVDHHVAATDHVEPRERRIFRQILARKNAAVAHTLRDSISAVGAREPAAQSLGRELGGDALRILAATRAIDGWFANVGSEDLKRTRESCFRRRFEQHDRERVRFFAGGAARHPHAHRIFDAALTHQGRQIFAFQRVEDARITKEAGDADQNIAVQLLDFIAILAEKLDVISERLNLVQRHPTANASLDRRRFVIREVDVVCRLQNSEHTLHFFFGKTDRTAARDIRVARDANDLLRDLARRQREIDEARRDRGARHAVELRALILRECDSAFRFDSGQTGRAVASRSGEHDADCARAFIVGERSQADVDRQKAAAIVRALRRESSVFDGDDRSRHGDVNAIDHNRRAVGDRRDRQLRRARNHVRQRRRMLRVGVQ